MPDVDIPADIVDADTVAQKIKNPKSINLIVLGFALATAEQAGGNQDSLFCNFEDIKAVLKDRFSKNKKIMLDASMKALQAGYNAESVK
jgi:indolepyruvate ferredoxin oxidoreductase beta subunit